MTFTKQDTENPATDAGETSPFPAEMQAQMGQKAKAKTHRGRRSKGKGAKQHHTEAKAHVAKAQAAPTPAAALPHLFAAIRSMHASKQASQLADEVPATL